MSAGKVFHTKAHARQKNEKYYTPEWATLALLRHFDVMAEGWTWEPAAGNGDMVRPLQYHGARVLASDISPDYGGAVVQNFLTVRSAKRFIGDTQVLVNKIATNPPFGTGGRLAFQFAHHALRLMEPVKGKVAMLLRDDFDSAGGRTALFGDHPAWHQKIVLTERIRWVNLPQSTEHGPSGAHAWFIWDWARTAGPATLAYEGRQ